MSKFRARQLDASKPISIYYEEDINDSAEFNNATNRTVPQLPTGMEKEEETEHHLQQAIFHHRVIPVPEVYHIHEEKKLSYDCLYPPTYKSQRQMIHIHPFSADQDIPDYDMDSSDEEWLNEHTAKGEILPLDPLQFEEMMDRLEKASGLKAVTLQEAKYLLKDDDDLITSVYDYWLNKRLRLQHPLLLQVRSEKGICGSASTDPYVAFRKRTEKMQTRKNRKTEEQSYEKMLKLKRDLVKAVTLLEMLKRREKSKREFLHLNIELFEKRYDIEDFSGSILSEVILQSRSQSRSAFTPLVTNHQAVEAEGQLTVHADISSPQRASWIKGSVVQQVKVARKRDEGKRERRPYKKKRRHGIHSSPVTTVPPSQIPQYTHPPDPFVVAGYTRPHTPVPQVSEDDETRSAPPSDEDTVDSDGLFTFRRKAKVCYLAAKSSPPPPPPPSPGVSWGSSCSFRGNSTSNSSQFYLTSVREPKPNLIGWARRRVGRGGRVWLDRVAPPLDERLKLTEQRGHNGIKNSGDFLSELKNDWPHFRPSSPSNLLSSDSDGEVDVETLSSSCPPSPFGDFGSSTLFVDATVLDGTNEGTTTPLQVTIPASSSLLSNHGDDGSNGPSCENPFSPSDPGSELSTSNSGLWNYKNSHCNNANSASLGTVKKKGDNNKWMSSTSSANVNSVNSTKNCLLNSYVSKAGSTTNRTVSSLQHSTQDFHTQPSSKFLCLDLCDSSSSSSSISNQTSHNAIQPHSLSAKHSRSSGNSSSLYDDSSSHPRMNSGSTQTGSQGHSLSSSISSSSMLVKNLSSPSSYLTSSFSQPISPSPSPKNKRDNILTQPESASKKSSSSSSGSLSSIYVQRAAARDFESSKSVGPSFILSNSKNNGNALLNNSLTNSNLVSQKLLTWTKGEDPMPPSPLSNGPSSKLTSANNKCATKVTQIIFPES